MTNPQTGSTELVAAQAQPHVVVNALARAISKLVAGSVTIDFAADDTLALTVEQALTGAIVVTDSGTVLTQAQDVIFPNLDSAIGAGANARPQFLFVNQTAQELNVGRNAGGNVIVPAGESMLCWYDGTDVQPVSAAGGGGGGGGSSVYDVYIECGAFGTTVTTGNEGYIVAARDFLIEELIASVFSASSSGDITIDIEKNGASVFGSAPLQIDVGEKTSLTSSAPYDLQDNNVSKGDELRVVVITAGTAAAGLRIGIAAAV
jgi:hypothetical protein